MPKRFTATEKWLDPWFCGLVLQDKIFWVYILDNCDHAGIWQVNWPLAKFHLNNYEFNEPAFKGRVCILSKEKWFIPKFIDFQYGELNPENRAHESVIKILQKEGAYKLLNRGIQGRTDKEQDKDKDKVKDKGIVKGFQKPQVDEVSNYAKSIGYNLKGQEFINKYDSIGWLVGKNKTPMKDWKAVVRTWYDNEKNSKPKIDPEIFA